MVTLVQFDSTPTKGRLRRFFTRCFGKKVALSGGRVAGAPYCLVTVRTENGIPWEEVEAAVGAGNRTVFERGAVLPVGLHFNRVDGEALRRKILLNGAVWIVEHAAGETAVGDVALMDRFGRFAKTVPRLMQTCRTLTVVTANTDEYRELAERLYATMGAAPMITDQASGASGCVAVIAPDGLSGFGAMEKPPWLFTPDGRDGCTVTEKCVRSPFEESVLEKFDLFELLTAFHGERLFRDVGSIVPHSMVLGREILSLQQLSRRFGT